MLESKKITTVSEFINEVTLEESNFIKDSVNATAFMINDSNENQLLDLNQTIVKDIFAFTGKRGFHLIAKFKRSENEISHPKISTVDIDVMVTESDPVYIFDRFIDMELNMIIKTINQRKYALQ